jgi:D-alanyl-D-alanine carboxypeptidase (penicillin-binding protein 5/6)
MPSVPATAAKPLNVTMQVESRTGMKTQLRPMPGLTAPIHVGQRVGTLVITAPEFPSLSVPVYASQSVAKTGFFGGWWNSVKRMIGS